MWIVRYTPCFGICEEADARFRKRKEDAPLHICCYLLSRWTSALRCHAHSPRDLLLFQRRRRTSAVPGSHQVHEARLQNWEMGQFHVPLGCMHGRMFTPCCGTFPTYRCIFLRKQAQDCYRMPSIPLIHFGMTESQWGAQCKNIFKGHRNLFSKYVWRRGVFLLEGASKHKRIKRDKTIYNKVFIF